MTPKFVKFSYRNRERLWLKVEKEDKNFYYGWLDNKPITTHAIKLGDKLRVNKNKVVEVKK